jgi:hypothetical protein
MKILGLVETREYRSVGDSPRFPAKSSGSQGNYYW